MTRKTAVECLGGGWLVQASSPAVESFATYMASCLRQDTNKFISNINCKGMDLFLRYSCILSEQFISDDLLFKQVQTRHLQVRFATSHSQFTHMERMQRRPDAHTIITQETRKTFLANEKASSKGWMSYLCIDCHTALPNWRSSSDCVLRAEMRR